LRALLATVSAERLSPPRVKKSSSTPTASRPRTSVNRSHNVFSVGVRGPRTSRAASGVGSGSAVTSSLPLTVNGNPSTTAHRVGTM
jgi:hypothetical protein